MGERVRIRMSAFEIRHAATVTTAPISPGRREWASASREDPEGLLHERGLGLGEGSRHREDVGGKRNRPTTSLGRRLSR